MKKQKPQLRVPSNGKGPKPLPPKPAEPAAQAPPNVVTVDDAMKLPQEERERFLAQNLALVNGQIRKLDEILVQTNERLADLQALVIKMQGKSS